MSTLSIRFSGSGINYGQSRPVSRVLSGIAIHLASMLPSGSSSLPESNNEAGHLSSPIWPCSGWGLPCPRCHHRGGELLPRLFTLTPHLSILQSRRLFPSCWPLGHNRSRGKLQWPKGAGRYVFCGTFRGIAARPRYGPPCPVELGLSSPLIRSARNRGATIRSALAIYQKIRFVAETQQSFLLSSSRKPVTSLIDVPYPDGFKPSRHILRLFKQLYQVQAP